MKINIPKDWCINMAKLDGDGEIGAGSQNHQLRMPPRDEDGDRAMTALDSRIAQVLGYTAPEDIPWKLRLLVEGQTAILREALTRIERTTKGYDEYSQMGAVHIIARDALKNGN